MSGADVTELLELAQRTGKQVILVAPGQEPVVLVPLAEYNKLTAPESNGTPGSSQKQGALRSSGKQALPQIQSQAELSAAFLGLGLQSAPARSNSSQAVTPTPQPTKLEAVDPQQGGLPGDDQYFPEPLD